MGGGVWQIDFSWMQLQARSWVWCTRGEQSTHCIVAHYHQYCAGPLCHMQKDNDVLIHSSLYSGQKWAHLDATGSFSLVKRGYERRAVSFPSTLKAACAPAARWLHAVTWHVRKWNGLILEYCTCSLCSDNFDLCIRFLKWTFVIISVNTDLRFSISGKKIPCTLVVLQYHKKQNFIFLNLPYCMLY